MNKISINKNEVLRYLGYKNQHIGKTTNVLIDECIEEMKGLIRKKYIYKFFSILERDKHIYLNRTNLALVGNDIKDHLKDSKVCILIAATLGNDVDFKIRYYEKTNITKALILDACATTAIEEICDKICEDLEEMVKKDNMALTTRYSPGYGDLPIDIQRDFLSVLRADKSIGLTVSSHNILIPRKSITAIVGVIDIKNKQNCRGDPCSFKNDICLDCKHYLTCVFKREG